MPPLALCIWGFRAFGGGVFARRGAVADKEKRKLLKELVGGQRRGGGDSDSAGVAAGWFILLRLVVSVVGLGCELLSQPFFLPIVVAPKQGSKFGTSGSERLIATGFYFYV